MPDYFPEGSNEKPSEASPRIWTDFDGFKNAALKNETASKKLMVAAQAKNQQAVIDGFKAVAASCKNCHQSYKLDWGVLGQGNGISLPFANTAIFVI